MKQLFVLGVCALFLACGTSTNERGIASATTDSTASGSAFKSNDGFAPASTASAASTPAASTPSAITLPDSAATGATPAAAPVAGTSTASPSTTPSAPAKAVVTPPVAAATPAAADNSADIKKGEALISKSDCLACHKVDAKVLGPSYKDVAAKYPNNAGTISQLASKIKKGGSGVWGAVPMSPHPALSDDDAKAMVRYILSLK